MNNLSALLQNCSLFKNKTPEEIEQLLSKTSCEIESFKENEVIFSPLQAANKIGVVLSGTVDVQKLFPTGKVVIIERKKSPDLIGESSIFSRLEHYPDTVSAGKPCQILFLLKNELLALFALDRDFMLNFLESASNSTLILKHKIGILSLDSIQEKIAGFLVHYKKHAGDANDYNLVTLPFSKKAWAEYMNVSRTSLSRELKALQTKGIISFEKRTIEIKDWSRLEKILSL